MDAFLKTLQTLPEVAELVSRVENGGCPAVLTGTQPVQRACVGAAVAAGAGRPMVFLCADEREARQLAGDLQSLTGETPVTLLAREWQFRPTAVSSREWERSRLAALHQMAAGNAPIVVATVDALLARTMPPHRLAELSVTLETGGRADLKELTDRLLQAGYSRCDQVEGVGQFALRGGILDVFSPLMEQPVRCEFFDDEIDSIGAFDPGTQRRTENVSSALLLPAAASLLDWGFANYALYTCPAGNPTPVRVPGGIQPTVGVRHAAFSCVLPRADLSSVEKDIELPEAVPAPVKAGDTVGKLTFTCRGVTLGEVTITADADVGRIGFGGILRRLLARFFLI